MGTEKDLKKYTILTFITMYDNGMSGGDRICLEFTRQWFSLCKDIITVTSHNGAKALQTYSIPSKSLVITKTDFPCNSFLGYSIRSWDSFWFGCTYMINDPSHTILYSSSDFWPDLLPSLILKIRYPKVTFIGTFYLTAPGPFSKDNPYRSSINRFVVGVLYFVSQLPAKWCVQFFADMVFVTSEPDAKRFLTKERNKDRVLVVKGGVDTMPAHEWLRKQPLPTISLRKYDACFIGRLHDQKGVIELLDIWVEVLKQKSDAKLAIIGNGPLEDTIKNKIVLLHLENNVELLGFQDGEQKNSVFRNSKIIVHPAIYDSGGMAMAEGMVWGIPGISFDLEALRTYYPKGVIKVPCYDIHIFTEKILELLADKKLYADIAKDAQELIEEEWGWRARVSMVSEKIIQYRNQVS